MLRDFLNSLKPDQDSLFLELSNHITDEMLDKIARADYGQDQELHLAPLHILRDQHIFVEPMHWYPCEVLELVRNSGPDGNLGTDDHWIRAFSCAALLRAKNEPWNYQADAAKPSFTLIQLLNSVDALPIDFTSNVVRLLAWMMLNSDLDGTDELPIYYGFAILWLSLRNNMSVTDQDLIDLSEWIVFREDEIHEKSRSAFDRWLLGIAHDPPPSPWEDVGANLAILNLDGRAQQLKEWADLIGTELSGNSGS
jgi:hypothetical protein